MSESTFAISRVIHPELVVAGLEAADKHDVIRRLSHLLAANGYLTQEEVFVADVEARELEGPTGLGGGIAIPHGKSAGVCQTTIAVARLAHPVEWESLDEEPIRFVILFAVQESDASTVHLKLLQQVAILLANDDFIRQLGVAETAAEIVGLFTSNTEE